MSKIRISDLSLNGSALFDDSEGFLQDLSDQQLFAIHGGESIISQVTVSVGLLVAPDQQTLVNVEPVSIGLGTDETSGGLFLI